MAPDEATRIVDENWRRMALNALLLRVKHQGFAQVQRSELLELLGYVRGFAGAYVILLERFESIGGARSNLYVAEFPGDMLLLLNRKVVEVRQWAGMMEE